MKIKIESDVFDIVNRIKEIDEGYFILFDTIKNRFELHNRYQQSTYCLSCPYDCLDSRMLDLIHVSNIANIDNIMYDIDRNNNIIEKNSINEIKCSSDYMIREIYKFCNNSSKSYDVSKAFVDEWR